MAIKTVNKAYQKFANIKCDPMPDWQVGTLVWLKTDNIKTPWEGAQENLRGTRVACMQVRAIGSVQLLDACIRGQVRAWCSMQFYVACTHPSSYWQWAMEKLFKSLYVDLN